LVACKTALGFSSLPASCCFGADCRWAVRGAVAAKPRLKAAVQKNLRATEARKDVHSYRLLVLGPIGCMRVLVKAAAAAAAVTGDTLCVWIVQATNAASKGREE